MFIQAPENFLLPGHYFFQFLSFLSVTILIFLALKDINQYGCFLTEACVVAACFTHKYSTQGPFQSV